MQEYDVAIVGGGPVGGYIAKEIAQRGYTVALFEEHKKVGEPLRCAGLITPRVFSLLDFPAERVVQNKIKGAHIHSPAGNILSIGGDRVHALVIDRPVFDREIINQSIERGTNIFLANKVRSANVHNNHVTVKTSKQEVSCRLLIGADGPRSFVRQWFFSSQPTEILTGAGAEVTNVSLDPDFVEIFVGNTVAPGFFAWMIPTNTSGSEARIGLCTSPDTSNPPKHYFSNLFRNRLVSSFLHNVKIVKHIGGAVPLGVLNKTYASHVLLVGDAAAQVKPTSGGGIYAGLVCARHCSSTVLEALSQNDFSTKFLRKYQKTWSAELGRELFLGMKFRAIFKHLSDKQFDTYIAKFQNQTITDVISRYGDIDYPSRLVKPLLKKSPSLLKFLPKILHQ